MVPSCWIQKYRHLAFHGHQVGRVDVLVWAAIDYRLQSGELNILHNIVSMLTKSSAISCWMLQVVFSTQKTARIPGHLHSRHSDDLLFGQCCRRISKLARNAGGSCPTGNIVQCPAMIMTRQDTGPWSGSFVHGFTGAVSEGTCAHGDIAPVHRPKRYRSVANENIEC